MLLEEEQLDSHSTGFYEVDYMPKLFTNGCSITLGAELGEETRTFEDGTKFQHCDVNYRTAHRWSTLLAEMLEMEPKNLSRGGGSNWRIWRTTQDYLLENSVSLAVIQMTEPSRFQIPISFDFVRRWNPTKVTPTVFDWATGGIYGPSTDMGGGYEEYSHWNWGEQHQLNSFMNGDSNDSHYKNMADEITGFFLLNDQMHNFFDYLRHILYLHNMFTYHNIPHLIVDMLDGFPFCTFLKGELETITDLPEDVMLEKLKKNRFELLNSTDEYPRRSESLEVAPVEENDKDYLTWFRYVKKSNMSKKFNKLYNAVISLKQFDNHPYRNYFSRSTRSTHEAGSNDMYIGSMPGGHPNEQCHKVFAERMYNEIKSRRIL